MHMSAHRASCMFTSIAKWKPSASSSLGWEGSLCNLYLYTVIVLWLRQPNLSFWRHMLHIGRLQGRRKKKKKRIRHWNFTLVSNMSRVKALATYVGKAFHSYYKYCIFRSFWQLNSNFRGFSNGLCHAMKISTNKSNADCESWHNRHFWIT